MKSGLRYSWAVALVCAGLAWAAPSDAALRTIHNTQRHQITHNNAGGWTITQVATFPNSISTRPVSVNQAGQVAGTQFNSDGTHCFVYRNGTLTNFTPSGFNYCNVTGQTTAGTIVGAFKSKTGPVGFVYVPSKNQFTQVPDAQGFVAVNNFGLAVSFHNSTSEWGVYNIKTKLWTDLVDNTVFPPCPLQNASGINNHNLVFGYDYCSGSLNYDAVPPGSAFIPLGDFSSFCGNPGTCYPSNPPAWNDKNYVALNVNFGVGGPGFAGLIWSEPTASPFSLIPPDPNDPTDIFNINYMNVGDVVVGTTLSTKQAWIYTPSGTGGTTDDWQDLLPPNQYVDIDPTSVNATGREVLAGANDSASNSYWLIFHR